MTIQFNLKEFEEWFSDISEYIAQAMTKEELGGEGGGYISQFIKDGSILERCNLWFGNTEPTIKSYVILKGKVHTEVEE